MKKPAKTAKTKTPVSPAISQEYPRRLAELEGELRVYPSRAAEERALQTVEGPAAVVIAQEKVVQFEFSGKSYAAGYTDVTYAGSNHARGVRHIRFYADGKSVLEIEGDFEDQQFGSNFRFQNIELYLPGEWEKDFVKLSDELHTYKTKRRAAFNKKRLAELNRLHKRRTAAEAEAE